MLCPTSLWGWALWGSGAVPYISMGLSPMGWQYCALHLYGAGRYGAGCRALYPMGLSSMGLGAMGLGAMGLGAVPYTLWGSAPQPVAVRRCLWWCR